MTANFNLPSVEFDPRQTPIHEDPEDVKVLKGHGAHGDLRAPTTGRSITKCFGPKSLGPHSSQFGSQ